MSNLTNDILVNKKHIHFIGIGGSGMFPLAQILKSEGYYLTGSDNNETDTLKLVRDLGIPVMMGQKSENIQGADLIVHTAAIMQDNEELIAAKESGVTVIERSILLGIITARYGNTICVSGTHGKTTTSSMLTQILFDTNCDPTVVIGGKLPAIGGNGRAGKSDTMVCEACEFVNTFLELSPDTSIILNIDQDHMDFFKTMDRLIASFHKFCTLTSKTIIANGDDPQVYVALQNIDKEIITFGFANDNDYYPMNIVFHKGEIHTSYDLMKGNEYLGMIDVYVPGKHNVLNSIAAVIAALNCGVAFADVRNALANFKGAGRRFEVLGKEKGITVVDDYAHHPTEMKVTLEAAKNMNFKRVIAVHQPFTYSRTKMHLDYFAEVLKLADKTVLSEIMGSREKNVYNIFAKDLCDKIDDAIWFETFEEIADYVCDFAKEGDLIITMGCGDVYKAAKLILEKLKK